MKKIKFFLSLLLVCGLCLTCADDDKEEINALVCVSFLECQDQSVWKLTEEDGENTYITYFKLNNDLDNPVEVYSQNSGNSCYYYMDMSQADGLYEISENSKAKFSVRISGDENDLTEWDLTIDNNRLKLNIRNFENGQMYESFQMLMEKSSIDVNKFQRCDNI